MTKNKPVAQVGTGARLSPSGKYKCPKCPASITVHVNLREAPTCGKHNVRITMVKVGK